MTLPTIPPSPFAAFIREMHDLHERTFGPLRAAMPKPDPDAEPLPSLADALRPQRPDITINIYLNTENDQ